MKIYLSGGMRGYPHHNYPFFNDVTGWLRENGYEVVNPAEIPGTSEGTPRAECMRRDIAALLDCDAIAGLPGWQMSPGAQVEVAIMWSLNRPLFDVVWDANTVDIRLVPSAITSLSIPRETQYYQQIPLLGLCGYAQSGKDTAAAYLVENGWVRVAFADALRDVLYALDPIVVGMGEGVCEMDMTVQYLVDGIGWERAKVEFPEIRRLLQRLGTEAGRDIINEHLWVQLGEQKIEQAEVPVVVTDCRFPNEVQMIRRRGGKLVWVHRPGVEAVNSHASEHSVTPADCDELVENNSSIEDFHRKVRALVTRDSRVEIPTPIWLPLDEDSPRRGLPVK